MRQEAESAPFQFASASRAQQQPRQQQQGNQRRQNTSERRFTEFNMSLSQALKHMLEAKMVILRDPPQNPNTASPRYNPNARCAYHSNSLGHDTNRCWTLRNKIQDLIEEGTLEFTQDGQTESFRRPSKVHHLK